MVSCLRFPVTNTIYSAYQADNPDLFQLISSSPFSAHLLLYCHPDEYKPSVQELGSTEIIPGFSTMVIAPVGTIYGFEVTTVESRTAAFEVLDRLRKAAIATPGSYTPIQVLDGHHVPFDGAIVTIDGVDYCDRRMRMTGLQPQGGSLISQGQRFSANGFTLKMVEVSARSVF